MNDLLATLIYPHTTTRHCLISGFLLVCQCRTCVRTTEVVVSQQDNRLYRWSNLDVPNAFGKTVVLIYRVNETNRLKAV